MAMAQKPGRVRGVFLALVGLILLGIGGALYFGDLDMGSVTRNGTVQPVGNGWAFLPVGLGVTLVVVGIAVAVLDRRKR